MIKAIYKRKGLKYQCTIDKSVAFPIKLIRLLSRGGVRFMASLSESSGSITARVFNLAGVYDEATFKPGQGKLAKEFIYRASKSDSRQLSLFWGAM